VTVRFTTSVAGSGFSYIEGQTLDLPTPLPSRFARWLAEGLIETVRDPWTVEQAVAYPAGGRAVLSQRPRRRRGRRAKALA